jgi:hypothetical protein
MKKILLSNLEEALVITVFVFAMMVAFDYIEVLTRGKMSAALKGGRLRQYSVAPLFGVLPGCFGAFMNVSFYVHGFLSFGAIVGGMIATSGDGAFLMLTKFPHKAFFLFGVLYIIGFLSSWAVDKLVPILRIKSSGECKLFRPHPKEICYHLDLEGILSHFTKITPLRFLLLFGLLALIFCFSGEVIFLGSGWSGEKVAVTLLLSFATFIVVSMPNHYLEEHLWHHITKKHLWRVFLWSFLTLVVVDLGFGFWNLEHLVKTHVFWVLLIATLVGIIPESGPHYLFIIMFAEGIIPFSVLLASSIVQDGHGMLPLLSYTIRDSLLIKLVNFLIGLTTGVILYILGF